MKKGITAVAACMISGSSAAAQDAFYWTSPGTPVGTITMRYFPLGTPLMFRTRTELNTKQAKPGDRFYLDVAESLTFRGQVIVPIGAPAVGEVVRVEKNGNFGKKGTIEVRLLHVQTPHGPVRLNGQAAGAGKDQSLLSVGSSLVFGLGPFLIHGTSGYIRHGKPIVGYLAENMRFAFETPAPTKEVAAVQPDQSNYLSAVAVAQRLDEGAKRGFALNP